MSMKRTAIAVSVSLLLVLAMLGAGCDGHSNPKLTVDVDISAGGTVRLDPQQPADGYEAGTVVTLDATPNAGYTFDQWSGDASGTDESTTVTMDSDKTVTAHFIVPPRFTSLDVDPAGSGIVTLTPAQPPDGYDAHTIVTLNAIASAGYTFDHWSGDVSGTDESTTVTMDSDKTVTAHFMVPPILTVDVDPAGSGIVTITPAQPPDGYDARTMVTLNAMPNAGYTFDYWSGDVSSTDESTTMTMDSNKTVTAHFCKFDPSKYGFESSDILWVVQTFGDSQAVNALARSDKGFAKFGCYSLRLAVDLVGGDENKSKGEAYVDMRFFPPTGMEAPLNLEGVPITVWVYVPGSAAGDPSKPNGVQVFVKDKNWKNEYGTWLDLPNYTDKWIPITLTPSRQQPPMGYMDEGFDPSAIIAVGVKIGAGTPSTATYQGPIYVDGVNW